MQPCLHVNLAPASTLHPPAAVHCKSQPPCQSKGLLYAPPRRCCLQQPHEALRWQLHAMWEACAAPPATDLCPLPQPPAGQRLALLPQQPTAAHGAQLLLLLTPAGESHQVAVPHAVQEWALAVSEAATRAPACAQLEAAAGCRPVLAWQQEDRALPMGRQGLAAAALAPKSPPCDVSRFAAAPALSRGCFSLGLM